MIPEADLLYAMGDLDEANRLHWGFLHYSACRLAGEVHMDRQVAKRKVWKVWKAGT